MINFILFIAVEGWVIVVTGLHEETTEDDLSDKFGEFGTIVDFRMPLDHRSGFVKGYALIKYAEVHEAQMAVSSLHESLFLDSVIQCDFAFTNSSSVESNTK